MIKHAFVVSAFGQSRYLKPCLDSVLSQSRNGSDVLIVTSTPSPFLNALASEFGIRLIERAPSRGIASDWNLALTAVEADLLTIVHQDDVYDRHFAAKVVDAVERHPNFMIAFTNSTEQDEHGPRRTTLNLRIKRWLTERGFKGREAIETPREKLRLLEFGNPICCPSVTINRRILPNFRFANGLMSNLDWEAWHELAKQSGKFVYLRQPLVSKRVHAESETTALMQNRLREREDREMFGRFWPRPVAAALSFVYRLGYLSNPKK